MSEAIEMQAPIDQVPATCEEAAHYWLDFGFDVIPLSPDSKTTACRWPPWLDALGHDAITDHWRGHPRHHLGFIVDHRHLVLDADTPESVAALRALEEAHDVEPGMIVTTRKGEHHYYRRAAGTYAKQQGFGSEKEPEKIDVKTGRGDTEGRSMVVLPPTKGKVVELLEAGSADEFPEVGQDFIDAVFRHNGREAPRKPESGGVEQTRKAASDHLARELLEHLDPDMGYGDWLKVLMGLHDEFDGNETGLAIADEWSARGDNYPGAEEVEYKWRSFTPGGGLTFASVAQMAREAGADLTAIRSRYNADGSRKRTEADMLADAEEMTEDTDSETVSALVAETLVLPAVSKRRVREVIRKQTGLPYYVMDEADRDVRDSDDSDDLGLARALVVEIGRENVLSTQAFVYHWCVSGVWQRQADRSVRQWVQRHLDGQEEVRKSLVDSVTDLFRTEIFKPQHEFDVGPVECVNTPSGELVLEDGEWHLTPHKREHYRTTQIPVEYDPSATAPRFKTFLAEVFEGDADAEQKARALLEMIGYSLMAHCRHERFIIMVGSGANGKSVLLSVLEALLGGDNVAGVQPSQFDRSFQRAHLHGKLANIVTEVKQGEVIDDASLKGIVSGEPTTVEHKFKDPFMMRPFATCWFGTNHMPHTRDFSDALFRRVLVIQFNNVFKPERGNCDPMLKETLLGELPGILNMALQAYADAVARGTFTMPASSENAAKEWRLEADQVAQFVEDVCEPVDAGMVKSSILFGQYEDWASENGIHHKVGSKSFRDRLTKLGFGAKRRSDGQYVTGIKCNRGTPANGWMRTG